MQAFLDRRRRAAAAAWDLDGGVVLVAAGDAIPIPGRGDQVYPFRALSHGVGHMVGLGVRDMGQASDETREPAPGLPRLRVDIVGRRQLGASAGRRRPSRLSAATLVTISAPPASCRAVSDSSRTM